MRKNGEVFYLKMCAQQKGVLFININNDATNNNNKSNNNNNNNNNNNKSNK